MALVRLLCLDSTDPVTSQNVNLGPWTTMTMRLATLLLVGTAAWPAVAQEQAPATECELGLVLSGGGARGAAHIGVLEVLEENGIRPDCVAGASMGAVVGSLYAAGFPLVEINALINNLTWRNIYAEPMNRASMPIIHRLEQQRTALRVGFGAGGLRFPRGLLHDGRLNRELVSKLAPAGFAAARDFDRLPIPFRAVGTDLRTGDRVILSAGDLARAVRASMSVPLAYPPVIWGEYLLVDGGLVDNLPVDLAREMGAKFVIAVDVQTPIEPDIEADVVGVTRRIIDLLYDTKNRENASPADLTISPELGEHGFGDYSAIREIVQLGREAGAAALAQIPSRYRDGQAGGIPLVGDEVFGTRPLAHIEVTGNSYLSDDVLIRESELEVGQRFVFDDALKALDHLYSTSLVQGAWIDVTSRSDGAIGVDLQVVEQYRQTADIGLAYHSDDQAQGFLRLETRDPFGGGERIQLSAFASGRDLLLGVALRGEQLFGAHLGYRVDLEYHEEKPKFFRDIEFVNRAKFERFHLRLAGDWQLGGNHLGQAGFLLGTVDIRERLGLEHPASEETLRTLFARYVWDNLESLTLPRRGVRIEAMAERNEEGLGATSSFWRVDSSLRVARGVGAVVLEGRARYGFSSGDLPVSEWFQLGGPELIPGVAREEFWGKQAAAGSITVGYDPFSVVRVYGRVGVGGVWERSRDVGWTDAVSGFGLGATIATPIGPLQLDYGWADDSRNRLDISIGWQ